MTNSVVSIGSHKTKAPHHLSATESTTVATLPLAVRVTAAVAKKLATPLPPLALGRLQQHHRAVCTGRQHNSALTNSVSTAESVRKKNRFRTSRVPLGRAVDRARLSRHEHRDHHRPVQIHHTMAAMEWLGRMLGLLPCNPDAIA